MSTTTATPKKAAKIYHLLPNSKSSVEIYTRINGNQRVKDEDYANERPYLQVTFTDKDGYNKTIRFKLNCNTPFQEEQIEKFKIPANEKFTNPERDMLQFKNGVLYVTNQAAINFLDVHPQNAKFEGDCPDCPLKLFTEYNPQEKASNEVSLYRRRLEAMNKVMGFELPDAQDTLIRLYGTAYKAPDNLDDCVIQLVACMDDTDEQGVEELLRDGKTLEDEITILIGKLLTNGVLSFDEPNMENFIVKKKNGVALPLKELSAALGLTLRKQYFAEFLAAPEGKLLLEDLRKEVVTAKKEEKTDTGSQQQGNGTGGGVDYTTMKADEKIALIKEAKTEDEVMLIFSDDVRATVIAAKDKRIEKGF